MKNLYCLKFSILLAILFVVSQLEAANVGGVISSNTTWSGSINVTSDLTINDGVTLTVNPGTNVTFNGHYMLNVQGRLLAQGNKSNYIIFTAQNSSTGWAGIRFDQTPSSNNQSIIEYCKISYGKANSGTSEQKQGGAIFVKDYSNLIIRNNIISNNSAIYYGGAISCRVGASPTIVGNIIVNNSSNSLGGGIYMYSNANPKIDHNTIANNTASNGGGIYANNTQPYVYDNIIYGNTASSISNINTGINSVNYNIIEGGYSGNNGSGDPLFASASSGAGVGYDGLSADWSLQSGSPAINGAYPYASTEQNYFKVADFDVYGNFRFDNDRADIGAVEFISSTEVCGNISTNTTWSGNVLVNCNITVNNGVTLTIQPGTKVLFTGKYHIDISGRILAQGNYNNKISFLPWNKTNGWGGITFNSTNATNDTSKIEYSIIKYKNEISTYPYYYGAISINSFNKVVIRNNIITNNKSRYGGGLGVRYSSAVIVGNLIANNEATSSYGGGVYMYGGSSYIPKLYNNTVVNNKAVTSGCGLYKGGAMAPVFKNNIFYGNADNSGNHTANDNIYPTGMNLTYCLVEGAYSGTGNISSDPLFKNPTSGVGISYSTTNKDFTVNTGSGVIDHGSPSSSGLDLPPLDINGKIRVYNSRVDIGAYEDKSLYDIDCSSSTITSDEVWDANVIQINCNKTIASGVTVTIAAGTKVRFTGKYRLTVNGNIIAKGASSNKIKFTATNTTTGWDGLSMESNSVSDSSIFEYCIFEYGKHSSGGAMELWSDNVRVSNCTFENNHASSQGGAIYLHHRHPTVENCNFINNQSDSEGGAMWVISYLSSPSSPRCLIKGNTFKGNSSGRGGGIYLYASEVYLLNNTFINNTATRGGGIYSYGNRISQINGNLIANNEATNGGGIYLSDCNSLFINNTIANNRGSTTGGGIFADYNSDPSFKSCIIYGNQMNNSSLISNQVYLNDNLSDPKFYYCDIEGDTTFFAGLGAGTLYYHGIYSNNIAANPLFAAATSGSGTSYNASSADFSLVQGSPAINAGVRNTSGMVLLDNDIAANKRVYNGRIDQGAYENQDPIEAPCTITSDVSWDADTILVNCNLTINNGVTVTIGKGTTILFTGKYSITLNGAIQALGTADEPIIFTASDLTNFSSTTIDQGGWSGIRIISTAQTNDSTVFDYCKFYYGKASGTTNMEQSGGAICIYNYPLVRISHSLFASNFAWYKGGALYVESSSISFTNNIVVNNTVDPVNKGNGGGMYIEDSPINFVSNTVANNEAKYGGGLFVYSTSAPSFKNSIFYGNALVGYSNGSQIHLLLTNNVVMKNCDLQGGYNEISGRTSITTNVRNIDQDPIFVNPTSGPGIANFNINANWNLKKSSPLINGGTIATSSLAYDFNGHSRIVADTIDIGAVEVQISPRFITAQPRDKEICVNTSTSISALASIPAVYQWQHNGTNISGATSAVYSISNLVNSDTGDYNCIISNDYGSISTDTVTIASKVAPSVISSPTSTSACVGSSANFTASIDGTNPITYAWYNINGALGAGTTDSYTINSVTANDASTYRLKASNSCGSVFTNGASLTVKTIPAVTDISAADDICENGSYTYTTSATGTSPITYQWYKDGNVINTATSVSYNISSAATTDAGTYFCRATNVCGVDQTNQAVLTINELPAISVQPSSATVCENQSYTLSVTASGAAPLTYQWYKGGSAINNATNNTYTISSVSTADEASYYCVVSNTCNSTTSSTATITVNEMPVIASQTSSVEECAGSAAVFSITATGTAPLSYQWYNANGSISSATNNSYTISSTSSSDAGNYYCVSTNSCGSATSSVIPLTVNTAPSISSQPSDETKCEDQSVIFSVQASGTATLTYQWYKGATSIVGANSSSYLLSPLATSDAANYYCKVSNLCGNVSSNTAQLTVNSKVSISSQSASQTLCEGTSPALFVNTSGTVPITYQWYDDNGIIGGATSNSYNIASLDTSDASSYYCIATNACASVNSNPIVLSVNQMPTIDNNPVSTAVCENSSAVFNVSISGTSPITSQWYNNSGQIAGATATSYIIPQSSSADAGTYYVKATNSCGTAVSTSATLTVNTGVAITAQSTSATVCDGASPSFSITTSGTAPITYQWYKDNTAINSATNNTYNLTSVDTSDAATYYVIATNTCNTSQSNLMLLTVNESPTINSQPSSATVCSGSATQLGVSATGTAPMTYQWYKGGSSITGGTNSSYLISPATSADAGTYYVKATNSCGTAVSNNAIIIVNAPVTISSQTGDSTKCEGESMTFSVNATGTAPISYQWYHSSNAISGAILPTYTIASVSAGDMGDYYCVVSNSCNSLTSNTMALTVNVAPTIVSQSSGATKCNGDNITLNINTTGTNPISYQWYDANGVVNGAISNVYSMYSLTTNDANSYYCTATNSCGAVSSSNIQLVVNESPVINSQSSNTEVCENSSANLSIGASGTATLTYQWYNSSGSISNASNNTYILNNVDTSMADTYYCIVSNSCGSAQSQDIALTVNQSPVIVSQSSGATKCVGGSFSFNLSSGGSDPLSYQWYNSSGSILGATSSLYLLNSLDTSDADVYYCIVTNSCGSVQSSSKTLVVNSSPSFVSQSGSITQCENTTALFTLLAEGSTPLSYQWFVDTGMVAGANANSYTIPSISTANAGNYYCVVSNTCGSITTSNKVLTVDVAPVIVSQSIDDTLCENMNEVFQMGVVGTSPMTYQWYKNTLPVSGAINPYLTIASVDTNDAATYYAEATNLCGSVQSNNIHLLVNKLAAITFQSGDSSRCEGQTMTFDATTLGSMPIQYQWYKGTNPISGAVLNHYHIDSVATSDAGYYHLNVSNMCNTVSTNYKLLSVHTNPVINLGDDTTFCDGGSIVLTPGYGYQCRWSNGSFNNSINVTATGSYFVNLTNQYGCQGNSDTVNVNVLLPYAHQQICIVSVDSATNKNVIVWEKAPVASIQSFNIYKESAVSNVWTLIGNVDYDSLSVFLDLTSTPDVKPERYSIAVVDSCGNESARSIAHRTMHLTINAGQTSTERNLLWNAYEGFRPSTYRIYRADSTLNYVEIDSIAGSSNYTYLFTDHNAPLGRVYYMIEIVHPQGGCSPAKANTNYNYSRSNRANSGIAANTALIPDFIASQTHGMAPMIVQFYDQTTNGTVDTWFWNFGDGGNSAVQNPVHQYDSAGVYHVALTVSNSNGTESIIKTDFIDVLPDGIENIHANFDVAVFPNPYKGSTNIAYALAKYSTVRIDVYSSLGELVTTIVDEKQNAGSYKYSFNATKFGFAPGVYYLKLRLDNELITKMLIEVK